MSAPQQPQPYAYPQGPRPVREEQTCTVAFDTTGGELLLEIYSAESDLVTFSSTL